MSKKNILTMAGGELSEFLYNRVDYPKYHSGCYELNNFVVTPYGNISKRNGFRNINHDVGNFPFQSRYQKVRRLCNFVFSNEESYVVCISPKEDTPANTFGYVIGIDAEERFGNSIDSFINIVNVTTTQDLNWNVDTIRFAQSGDVMILVDGVNKPIRISRMVDASSPIGFKFEAEIVDYGSWFLAEEFRVSANNSSNTETTVYFASDESDDAFIDFSEQLSNGNTITVRVGRNPEELYTQWISNVGQWSDGDRCYYDGYIYEIVSQSDGSAAVDVIAGKSPPLTTVLDATHDDGNIIWKCMGDGYAEGEIVTQSEADNGRYFLNITKGRVVYTEFGESSNVDKGTTLYLQYGAFNEYQGFPSAVALHEGRLILASTVMRPLTIWASTSDDVNEFRIGSEPADSWQYGLASSQRNRIHWLVSSFGLIAGTSSGEFILSSSAGGITSNAINVRASQISRYGSSQQVPAILIEGNVCFVSFDNKRLYLLQYNDTTDSYQGQLLSILAEHLLFGEVRDLTYTYSDSQLNIYMISEVENKNTVVCLTYIPQEDIYSFSRYTTKDTPYAISTIHAQRNELKLVCAFDNAKDVGCVCMLESSDHYLKNDTDMTLLDNFKFYNQVRTMGFDPNSYESLTVTAVIDGVIQEKTAFEQDAGMWVIALDETAEYAYYGEKYTASYQTMPLPESTARTSQVRFCFNYIEDDFSYLKCGLGLRDRTFKTDDDYPLLNKYHDLNPYYTEWEALPSNSDSDAMIRVEHSEPKRVIINSIEIKYKAERG